MSSAGPAKGTVGNDFVCLSACLCGLGTASFLWSLGDFLQPLIFPIKCEFLQITSSTFYPLIYGHLYNSLIFLSSTIQPTSLPRPSVLKKLDRTKEKVKTAKPAHPLVCAPLCPASLFTKLWGCQNLQTSLEGLSPALPARPRL